MRNCNLLFIIGTTT